MNLNNVIKSNYIKILSIVLMFIPCLFLFDYNSIEIVQQSVFGISAGTKPKSIHLVLSANFMIYSCALYFPIIIRNYKNLNLFNLIQHGCNLCVVCFMIAAALNPEGTFKSDIIPFFNMSGETFIIVAILFSWLGQKVIAGYAWIICLVVILSNIQLTSSSLGNLGGLLVLCVFVSILLQLAMEGFGIDNIHDFGSQFFNSSNAGRVKGDIISAGSATKSAASSVINKLK